MTPSCVWSCRSKDLELDADVKVFWGGGVDDGSCDSHVIWSAPSGGWASELETLRWAENECDCRTIGVAR
jgi:hypothetical protein